MNQFAPTSYPISLSAFRSLLLSALGILVALLALGEGNSLAAAEPDPMDTFVPFRKRVPDTLKTFVETSEWFVNNQKLREETRVAAIAKGEKVPALREQAEVKLVRRTTTTEARLKLLFRLADGEAVVEVWAIYKDGAWTTTDFDCNCSPSIKERDEFQFQARKLLLEIDGITGK